MAKLVHEHNKVNKGPPKKRKIHTMYSDNDSSIPIGFKASRKSKRVLKQLSAVSTSSSDESELGDGSGTPSSTATSSSNTEIEIDQDGGISANKSNQEEAAMLVALRNVIKKKEEKTSTIHDEEPAKDISSITTGVERPSFSAAGCDAGVAKTAHDAIQLMREDVIDFNWTEVRASSGGATTTTKERDVKATAAEDTSSTRTNSASASVTSKSTQDGIKLPSNWAERLLEEEIGIA